MPNVTLDWKPSRDSRNANFLLASLDCYASGSARRSVTRKKSIWLNQGTEGACTGFGAEHVRALSPYPQPTSNTTARDVYRLAQTMDEWEGESYEGSSVNGAMKAERELGYIREWRWCTSMTEVRHALSYHGAVEFGSWWFPGMWNVDVDGFVHPTGDPVGGHAYAVAGFNVLNGARRYWIENSWGPDWGINGGAWIWEDDLARLLGNDGECAVPIKVRV